MNNILVVNVNWLGDAVFSTPVFRALKQANPQARVSCLCVPRVADVLRHCPDIDEIMIYDEKGKDRWPWNKAGLITRLRRKRFDAAFLLHRSMTRALLVYLAGIPRRIGYGKAGALLTHPVPDPGDEMHRRDRYLKVVEAGGIAVTDRRCRLQATEEELRRIDQKLKDRGLAPGERFLVFNTGGNWDLKRWPLSSWRSLAGCVIQRSTFKVVFSGAAKDRADVREIMDACGPRLIDLSGQTDLGESLALFRRSLVVVSADSGPLHLAGSVGTKTIGLFGPTRPEITGPGGTGEAAVAFNDVGCNRAPCYHLACRHNVCMHSIGAEDVWKTVQSIAG